MLFFLKDLLNKKKSVPLFFLGWLLSSLFFFILSQFFPVEYRAQSEYLLKKQTASGFEALDMSRFKPDKQEDPIAIEPFFYSKETVKQAVALSGCQIKKTFDHGYERIVDGMKRFFSAVLKKERGNSFAFSDVVYLGQKTRFFYIRPLNKEWMEILYEGRKKKVALHEWVVFPDIRFRVTQGAHEGSKWTKYQVDSIQKAVKKVKNRLKIRSDKQLKALLIFHFSALETDQAQKFLKMLITIAEKRAAEAYRGFYERESIVLKNRVEGSFEKEKISREQVHQNQIELNEEKEKLKQLLTKEQALKEEEKQLSLAIQADYIFSHDPLGAKIQEKILRRKAYESFKKELAEEYRQFSLSELEALKTEAWEQICQIKRQKEKLLFTQTEIELTGHLTLRDFPVLTQLAERKQDRLKERFYQAQSEIQKQKQEVEEIEQEIKNTIACLFEELDRQEKKESEIFEKSVSAIAYRFDQEIALEKQNYFQSLDFQIKVIQEKLDFFNQEKEEVKAKINKKQIELNQLISILNEGLADQTLQENLKQKWVAKEIEKEKEPFLGVVLTEPNCEPFPHWQLSFFIVLLLGFVLTLSWMNRFLVV